MMSRIGGYWTSASKFNGSIVPIIGEDEAGDFLEGLEDSDAFEGNGLDDGFVLAAEFFLQLFDREDVRQVTLVELQDVGDGLQVVAVLLVTVYWHTWSMC